MAIIFDGPVTPQDATTFVRNVPMPANLVLNQVLPDQDTQAIEVDFNVVQRYGNTARFRAHDAPAHISPRDQMTVNRVPLMPLSDSKPVLGEREIANLYGLEYGNSPVAPVAESIYDDLTNITQDILRRAEQARGSVLSTGTMPFNGEGGLNGTLDMGVPGGNKVTAGTLFSSTGTADIITQFNTWRAAYIALNGYAPGRFITSTQVLTYMQQNTKLQSMVVQQFGPSLGGYAGLLPQNAINAILGSYNLPGLSFVYDTSVRVDGTNTLVMPNNIIIFLPPEGVELGYTYWGPTVTARKLAASPGFQGEIGPGIVGFVDRNESFPYKEQSFGDSLMLPVITNPNALMIATVA